MIILIFLCNTHFSSLSSSNGALISSLKSRDRRLKILINEWSEIFDRNLHGHLHTIGNRVLNVNYIYEENVYTADSRLALQE